ncbi:MAG: tRNA adenosine(34) deaminase TadA [Acidobacteria bacterium]|nr:tRNA adenosine(34) deaminase TadA [Acidobacteriota bacterium]
MGGHPNPESHALDEFWMRQALDLARQAEAGGEVPVGAVLVSKDNQLLSTGFNCPVATHDPTAHAEMVALRGAGQAERNYRLSGSTLYVTLEPCPMCAGAMVHARVSRLVFGARDLRFGGVRSKFQIADSELLNHRLAITEGVLSADCLEIMKRFFATRR